jgi:glutamate dehydrogenase (NAD(P)+)
MDTYSVNKGYTIPSICTGKPQSIGGSLSQLEATGFGVAKCIKHTVKYLDMNTESPTVVVQGLGQVGSGVASVLRNAGFTIVGVSDTTGGLHNQKGIDITKLNAYIARNGSMKGFSEGTAVTNEELLELECDVLVPCAISNQIHKGNAGKLRCKIVVEGANAPTTPEAEDILESRGIPLVPDILANSAGVTVGYFEWVQGLIRLLWTESEVYDKLDQLVKRSCERVFEVAKNEKMTLRSAAMKLALHRVMEARRLRGLYP